MITLLLGTSNRGKAAEFQALLATWTGDSCAHGDRWLRLVTLADLAKARPGPHDVHDVAEHEVAETGATLAENAAIKATAYAQRHRLWTLADDTALEVDALGGAPGLHTARYAGPAATAAENRGRLLDALASQPKAAAALEARGAQFVCALALADATGTIRATSAGHCRGRIRFEPSGDGGFGYDSLFEILEYRLTLAELGAAAKDLLSHRARAVAAIVPRLGALLGGDDSIG